MSIDLNIGSNKNSYHFRMHNKITADKENISYFCEVIASAHARERERNMLRNAQVIADY